MDDAIRLPVYARGVVAGYALLDPEDAVTQGEWRWYLRRGYVLRRETIGYRQRRFVYLHREVMGLTRNAGRPSKTRIEVDHINRDKLDNRKANLRACTGAQNTQNQGGRGGTSQYRGVSWCPQMHAWAAIVCVNYKLHRLGYYETEEEAAVVASAFRAEHMPFSEDARLAAAA